MKAEVCRKMRVRFGKYGFGRPALLVSHVRWSDAGPDEVDECCDPLLPEVVVDSPVTLRHNGLRMESVERGGMWCLGVR